MATLLGRAGPRRSAPTVLPFPETGGIRRVWNRLVENWRVTRTRRMLLSLDDRTLTDLGLSRADLELRDRVPDR